VAEEDAPTRDHRDPITQRVRVGLTGLAAVFLLTLLAASILNMLGQDDHAARLANGAPAGNVANAVDDPPKEPLAELGVAPGGNPAKTPAPVPAPVVSPPAAPARSTLNSMATGSPPPR
jgi:hypothetical protein